MSMKNDAQTLINKEYLDLYFGNYNNKMTSPKREKHSQKPSKIHHHDCCKHRNNDISRTNSNCDLSKPYNQMGQSNNKSLLNENITQIQVLNKKTRQIKSALTIAEQHNQQLHHKLTEQKRMFLQQKENLINEASKYKSLYEMLIQNYEIRGKQIKQLKKKLKKYQKKYENLKTQIRDQQQQNQIYPKKLSKYNSQKEITLFSPSRSKISKSPQLQLQNQHMSFKQILTQQQDVIQHLKHQNKLLKEQMVLKNRKLSEYQIILQSYQSQERMNSFAYKQSNNSKQKQLEQLRYNMKTLEDQLQNYAKDKQLSYNKIQRLEVELQATRHLKQSIEHQDARLKRQLDQIKVEFMMKQRSIDSLKGQNQEQGKWRIMYEQVNDKYQEILRFSYEIQKDFQRQLHTMAKEMTRRQIVKKSRSNGFDGE